MVPLGDRCQVFLDAFGPGGYRKDAVHGDLRAACKLGHAPRQVQLPRLRHAVVDQVLVRAVCRFAGDEDDLAGIRLQHVGEGPPAYPDTAHDVHVEDVEPLLVGDLGKGHHGKDPHVAHQHVQLPVLRGFVVEPVGIRQLRQVRRNPHDIGPAVLILEPLHGGRYVFRRAAVDDDPRAFREKQVGDSVSEPRRRPRDEDLFPFHLRVHETLLRCCDYVPERLIRLFLLRTIA